MTVTVLLRLFVIQMLPALSVHMPCGSEKPVRVPMSAIAGKLKI